MKKFFILIFILAIVFGIYFINAVFAPAGDSVKTVYFDIAEGESAKSIAKNLKAEGLIKSELIFTFYARLKGAGGKIIAGEHKLADNMNLRAILEELENNAGVSNEKKITLIEGWRADEIGAYLEKQNLVSQKEFLAEIKTDQWREQYDFLSGITAKTLEGFIFPDTYRVFKNAGADGIIKKCLANFDAKLTAAMRAEIKEQNKTIFEVITLASIVEREARTAEDKKMVADIFWKRLDKGIGFQSDATVNYITGKNAMRPSLADLQIDSPYNTYKYRGLPPGPIANPGLDAIMAAIYPRHNDYYYFINDSEGTTYYAKTYEEHRRNIEKYLE